MAGEDDEQRPAGRKEGYMYVAALLPTVARPKLVQQCSGTGLTVLEVSFCNLSFSEVRDVMTCSTL